MSSNISRLKSVHLTRVSTVSAVALIAVLAAPVAQAEYYDSGYSNSGYAEVVSSRPIYRNVDISSPREECWEEPIAHRDNRHWGVTAQTVTGGLIGAAIGNQAVHGSKRHAATGLGALVGAAVGANRASRQREAAPEYTTYERRCRTVEDRRSEQRVDGYDVSYRYGGQLYHTRLPYDPGRQLRVNVSVTPEAEFSRDSARYD